MPYKSPYTNARSIVDMINNGPVPGNVTKIHNFNDDQQAINYFYQAGAWRGTNFVATTDVSYALIINADTSFTFVGMHNPTQNIVRTYDPVAASHIYWISIPYNSPYTTARDVVDAINAAPTPGTVTKLHNFNEAQQAINFFYQAGAWRGTNFPIMPGRGYAMIINANTTWTPSVRYPQ